MGDASCAIIVTKSPNFKKNQDTDKSYSCIKKIHFETHADGVELTTIPGAGSEIPPISKRFKDVQGFFAMKGREVLGFTSKKAAPFLARLRPGLEKGDLEGIDWIVPHQASNAAKFAFFLL